jgi:hypothetical protein
MVQSLNDITKRRHCLLLLDINNIGVRRSEAFTPVRRIGSYRCGRRTALKPTRQRPFSGAILRRHRCPRAAAAARPAANDASQRACELGKSEA